MTTGNKPWLSGFALRRRAAVWPPFEVLVGLSPQAKLRDDLTISLDVFTADVVEKAAPFSHHYQQTATSVMVALVVAEMFGEMVDSLGEQSDLHLGRPGVALMQPVLGDYVFGALHYAER